MMIRLDGRRKVAPDELRFPAMGARCNDLHEEVRTRRDRRAPPLLDPWLARTRGREAAGRGLAVRRSLSLGQAVTRPAEFLSTMTVRVRPSIPPPEGVY